MMTVGDYINTLIQQVTMQFPDQDREVTLEDAMSILQTATIVTRGLIEHTVEEEAGK